MSRSLSRLQAVVLGAVLLAALALGGIGLFVLGSRHWPWNDTFDVHVGFPQAGGVQEGTRVRVQGLDAGEVTRLQAPRVPGEDVLLTLRLAGKWRGLLRADASARITSDSMLGGKVIEIDPGSKNAEPIADNAVIAAQKTMELPDMIGRMGKFVDSLEKDKAKVGEVADNANELLQKASDAATSIKNVSEALESAPLINSYVKNPQKVLFPPNCERNATWFAEADLFEPGTDRLTAQGRQRLNELVPRLEGLTRHSGSEMVVVAYSAPRPADRALARKLSENQSENVCNYLKNNEAVYKRWGVFPRKATPLGLGSERQHLTDKELLPGAGVGVLVFVPQK